MSNRTFHSENARLADCARHDAHRITPGFSDALHARVVQTIARLEAPGLRISQTLISGSPARYWLGPVSMAAIITLVIMPAVLLTSDHGKMISVVHQRFEKTAEVRTPAHNTQLAVYANAHAVNFKVQNAIQTAMAQEQYAGLDHDFRAATKYLVEQVPLRSAWESAGAPPER